MYVPYALVIHQFKCITILRLQKLYKKYHRNRTSLRHSNYPREQSSFITSLARCLDASILIVLPAVPAVNEELWLLAKGRNIGYIYQMR